MRTRHIYVVADIHGSDVCWRKFLNAARFYDVDTVLVAGDLTGKALVPLVERPDGSVSADMGGGVRSARTPEEISTLEQMIRFNGFYAYRCSAQAYERLVEDAVHRDEVFETIMANTLRSWLELADEKLAGSGIRAIVIPGNDDGWYVDDVLRESAEIINGDGHVVDLGEFQLLGFGPSNRTPWDTTRELDEATISERLDLLASELDPGKPTIVMTHVPPYGTRIDDAPRLRDDLSVERSGGAAMMVPVGSTAVRSFIERVQPMLSLHGHIHESRGTARLGRTIAINPGSEYSTGVLLGAIVSVKGDKVASQQLVAG